MNTLFAHNGVDHATSHEAVAHSAGSVLVTVLLISAAVVALITIVLYVLKRSAVVKLPVSKNKGK